MELNSEGDGTMNWSRGFFRIWIVFSGLCFLGSIAAGWDDLRFDPYAETYYYSPSEDKFYTSYHRVSDEVERDIFRDGSKETTDSDGQTLSSAEVILDKFKGQFIIVKNPNLPQFSGKFNHAIWKHSATSKSVSDLDAPSEKVKTRIVELIKMVTATAGELKAAHLKEFILTVVGFGIFFPFGVFAFGVTVTWIQKGFRHGSTQ